MMHILNNFLLNPKPNPFKKLACVHSLKLIQWNVKLKSVCCWLDNLNLQESIDDCQLAAYIIMWANQAQHKTAISHILANQKINNRDGWHFCLVYQCLVFAVWRYKWNRQTWKWYLQGSGSWCTGFLHCVEVLHVLDHQDMLCTGIHAYCNL